jgi:hypothetical protein
MDFLKKPTKTGNSTEADFKKNVHFLYWFFNEGKITT